MIVTPGLPAHGAAVLRNKPDGLTTLILSFSFLLCSLPGAPLCAAGVTLITHGFELDNSYPTWIDRMADAIAARADPSPAVYSIQLDYLPDRSVTAALYYERGTPPGSVDPNAEVIVKLLWHRVAGLTDTVNATDVANLTWPFFQTTNAAPVNGGPAIPRPLAELPIHLIGHSRGGAVVSEIARLFAQHAIWVDQMTTLDPHPATDGDPILARDPAVAIYNNVVFADNYYQIENYPGGEHVEGTVEQFLNDRFANDGLADGIFDTSADHTEVHDWYHGTIDFAATQVDGRPVPRNAWYRPSDIGFQFSLLAGGQALRGRVQFPYTGAGLKWITTNRSAAYTPAGFQWPNIELENTNDVWTVLSGTTVPVLFRFQNSFSNYVFAIAFGRDSDQNPYNNTAANLIASYYYTNVDASAWQFATIPWTPTAADNGQYFYAAITDYKGYVRCYYLNRPFRVLSALPRLNSPLPLPNGATQLSLDTEAGINYAIQASTNLSDWTTLTTMQATNTAIQFSDQQATNFPRRFYRALAF